MTRILTAFLAWFGAFFPSRHALGLELVAFRHQLAVLKRQTPRPKLSRWDRLFWLTLRRLWPKWSSVLLIVKPETVVRWHRAGFHASFLATVRPPRNPAFLLRIYSHVAGEDTSLGKRFVPWGRSGPPRQKITA